MEDTNTESALPESPQDIDRRLHEIASPEAGGVPPGFMYEVAALLAKMNSILTSHRGSEPIGFRGWENWVLANKRSLGIQRCDFYKWVVLGRHLLPYVQKDEIEKLGVTKAWELARLAKREPLSPEFLKEAFDVTFQVLRKRVDLLLETQTPWVFDVEVNGHTDVQAILLKLGELLDYETYAARADRTKPSKAFGGKQLGEIATVKELPFFGSEEMTRAARMIDVVWLKENWPEYFFEVEHSTRVDRGLARMFQVIKFNARFFVLGLPSVKPLFLRKIKDAPYCHYKDRYTFRTYDELRLLFNDASRFCKRRHSFFP